MDTQQIRWIIYQYAFIRRLSHCCDIVFKDLVIIIFDFNADTMGAGLITQVVSYSLCHFVLINVQAKKWKNDIIINFKLHFMKIIKSQPRYFLTIALQKSIF